MFKLYLLNMAFGLVLSSVERSTSRHRVGRQGTLLCKEINIGYL